MNNQKPSVSPAVMLQAAAAQADEKSNEQSLALAAQFMNQRIENGQLIHNKDIVAQFEELAEGLRPFLRNRLIQNAAGLINASFAPAEQPSEAKSA